MAAPVNKFKAALAQKRCLSACWLGMADTYVAEMAGKTGWDMLVVDGEHAPNDIRSIMAQLQVLEQCDSHVMVRLPVGQTHLIKQALDIGAQTLLIPMVESKAQAQDLAAAMRYAPQGERGVGAALARASGFNSRTDYFETANDQMCLFVQIETVAGLDALDDILTVDGVDGIFIGPADLTADMGHGSDYGHAEVRQATAQALAKSQAAGKFSGILTLDHSYALDCKSRGFDFVATAVDVWLYMGAMRDAADLLAD
jgi:4-hydroxy-2-oxoheptanedioate aldolase